MTAFTPFACPNLVHLPANTFVSSNKLPSTAECPALTMVEMRSLHFELFNQNTSFSWSPREAFDAREAGEIGSEQEYETLRDYLVNPEYRDNVADNVLLIPKWQLPKADALLIVYRAADDDCGAGYGAILPGASVTNSIAYAKRHADLYMDKNRKLLSTQVYPDELVTRGNPNEFTYVPRTLADGYKRYLSDINR